MVFSTLKKGFLDFLFNFFSQKLRIWQKSLKSHFCNQKNKRKRKSRYIWFLWTMKHLTWIHMCNTSWILTCRVFVLKHAVVFLMPSIRFRNTEKEGLVRLKGTMKNYCGNWQGCNFRSWDLTIKKNICENHFQQFGNRWKLICFTTLVLSSHSPIHTHPYWWRLHWPDL